MNYELIDRIEFKINFFLFFKSHLGIPKGSSDADRTLVSGIIVALAIGLQFLLSIKFSHHC